MSQSSCQEEAKKEAIKTQRKKREDSFRELSKTKLTQAAVRMCFYDGMDGKFDLALKVNRKKMMVDALRQVADKLEELDV